MFTTDTFLTFTYEELLDKAINGKSYAIPDKRASILNDNDFAGCSLQDAITMAKYGWKDSQSIKEIAYDLQSLMTTPEFKNSYIYDHSGDEVDVGRFLSNEPENMIQYTVMEDNSSKLINLIANITFSGVVNTSTIYNRGACIVTLINKLEDLGYKVKLDLFFSVRSKKTNRYFDILIGVKEYADTLDLDRIAYCLCHPSFLRRIILSILEQQKLSIIKEFEFYFGKSYGLPSDNIQKECNIYFRSLTNYNEYLYSSLESCVLEIQRQIKNIVENV